MKFLMIWNDFQWLKNAVLFASNFKLLYIFFIKGNAKLIRDFFEELLDEGGDSFTWKNLYTDDIFGLR